MSLNFSDLPLLPSPVPAQRTLSLRDTILKCVLVNRLWMLKKKEFLSLFANPL